MKKFQKHDFILGGKKKNSGAIEPLKPKTSNHEK